MLVLDMRTDFLDVSLTLNHETRDSFKQAPLIIMITKKNKITEVKVIYRTV